MVLHSTAPGRFSYQCGKSVPPPAKLMRTGVLARISTAFGSLLLAKASGRNEVVHDMIGYLYVTGLWCESCMVVAVVLTPIDPRSLERRTGSLARVPSRSRPSSRALQSGGGDW